MGASRSAADYTLAASTDRFQLLASLSLHGIREIDSDGRCRYTNTRWQQMAGRTFDESLDAGWTAAIHPEDRPAVVKEWQRCRKQGRDFTLEFRFRRPDGEILWVRARDVPIRAIDGTVLGYVGTDEDVSERRRAEEALARSEERYRRYFDEDLAGVYVAGPDGTILDCNAAAARMFGFASAQEVVGRNLASLYPDTQEGIRRLTVLLQQLLTAHRIDHHEDELQRRDGSRIHVLTTVVAELDAAGNLAQARGHILDVSGRKGVEASLRESEERFRLAFDSAPIGMSLVGADGRWLKVNRALCEILGYSQAELLRLTFQEITHPDDVSVDVNLAEQLWAGELRDYSLEKRYLHKDGHVVWILLTASVVRDPGGEPLYFISQVQDVSERKRLEAEREKLVDGLTEALRSVKTLSGLMPICAACKKVRDDRGYWQQIETYIRDHSEAELSHGICPDCTTRLYPQLPRKR